LGKVRIVTDSSAHFPDPAVINRYKIQVVPLTIHLGKHTFREGVDLDADTFFQLAEPDRLSARLSAPSVEDFASVYSRLNRETDQILSLHISRQITDTWDHALIASRTLLGRCEIIPVDSMTTSVGLALLVEIAAQAAEKGASLDEVVRLVRAMIPHIYSIFFVESLDYLRQNGLLSEAQSILGTMLSIKPFLTIEEGELIPMEKVRTQAQAMDKLVEFVTEFASIGRLVILQSSAYPTQQTRILQERLEAEFPRLESTVVMYGPSLAAIIGPDALGIVVLEDPDAEDDD